MAGRTTRTNSFPFWLPGGLAAVLTLAFGFSVSMNGDGLAEVAVYDRILRGMHRPADTDIVIVDIDDASVAKLGEWPFARDIQARLIDRLRALNVRTIAYTMTPGEATATAEAARMRTAMSLLEAAGDGATPEAQALRERLANPESVDADDSLARAMKIQGNVILPVAADTSAAPGDAAATLNDKQVEADEESLDAALYATNLQAPSPKLRAAAAALGHTAIVADTDRIVRRDFTGLRVGQGLLPSLAAVIAARSATPAQAVAYDTGHDIRAGDRSLALEDKLALRPHFYSGPEAASFPIYSYVDVLQGRVTREQLQDKIVLVGSTTREPATVQTPARVGLSATNYFAQAASSVVQRQVYVRPWWADPARGAVCVAVVLIAAFALPAMGLTIGSITIAVLVAVMIVLEVGLLTSSGLWLRLLLPCLAALVGLNGYALAELVRRAKRGQVGSKTAATNLRVVGETFRKQGQLDLAFETLRRAPIDPKTLDTIYGLGLDYERRRQFQKAAAVYDYIGSKQANYRDVPARRSRLGYEETQATESSTSPSSPSPRREPPMPSGPPRGDIAPSSRALGRYQIERELGKGAMGVVYIGKDPKINRVVAIKAIPLAEEFAEEDLAEARARFFREAEMAGRLNHPNIVTVYDAGEDQGLAYIAMEYLRGQHLSHYTEGQNLLPPKTVMLLVARVAEALHYAHRQNVVHRDIKPANIMFNPDADELKITDFGIARLTDTSRTKTGIVLGTPSFMSPEQLEGRSLDGRSDLFALGVSLYQLLAGQLPFRADSMPRLMQKIVTEPHPSVRSVRPELPACIDEIVERALAKSEQNRYQTGTEMAAALRSCAEKL